MDERRDARNGGGRTSDGTRPARRAGDQASPGRRVHVRRLDVVDTLRWSWVVARDRRELFGVALAAVLPGVVGAAGVSPVPGSAEPEVAGWVLPAYLAQLFAVVVATGAFSLTAADAVADDARPLRARLLAAVRRLPALVGATLAVALLVGLSLVPAVAATEVDRYALGSLLLLPAVYVLLRLLLAYQACVIDRKGPVASVRAGWRAAGGTVRKVFAVGVVYAFAVFATDVVSGLFGGPYDVATAAVGSALSALVFPVFGLGLAHLYLEGSRNR